MYKKNKMKYGGMKKKKVMKANQGVSVNFPEDHPDVEAQVKFINEQRMKKNKKYPKMVRSGLRSGLPEQEYTKQQASRDLGKFAKRRSARLTATEGSFKTGGMSKARGTGCAIRGTNFKGIF